MFFLENDNLIRHLAKVAFAKCQEKGKGNGRALDYCGIGGNVVPSPRSRG